MNRPTPISVFSDQRRTKSITWSRTSCGTQLPVRVPQDFFLARCARPSARPGPRPWSAPSSPRTQSASASPPPGGGDAPEPETLPLRSRRTPFASGRTPSASGSVLHTGPKLAPCPKDAVSKPQPFLQECSAFVPFSYVCSIILTEERFLHFQLRHDMPRLPESSARQGVGEWRVKISDLRRNGSRWVLRIDQNGVRMMTVKNRRFRSS